MAVARRKLYTPEEYLALEEKSEIRHEYFNGEIVAMAGGTVNHNLLVLNTVVALRNALGKRPCKVFAEGMRLHIAPKNMYTYPDVMVVCGKIEFQPGRSDVVLNPTVIFEVLSKSTRHYDRTDKFAAYRQLPTLQEYVMIEQDRVYVERLRKTKSKLWTFQAFDKPDATLQLPSLDLEIVIETLYQGLEEE